MARNEWAATDWLVGHSHSIVGMCQVLPSHLHCRVFRYIHLFHQLILSVQTWTQLNTRKTMLKLDISKITFIKCLGNALKSGILYHWCFGTPHWQFSLSGGRCHTDPTDLLWRREGRWEGWYGEWGDWLGWQWSWGGRESVQAQTLGGVCPSVALGALLRRNHQSYVLYWNTIFWNVSTQSVCVGVVMNLSEQTHLSEVVVSLLQSGELPQETLILSSLLIQLCPQSCTRLSHSLMNTLCAHTEEEKRGFWDTKWEKEAKKEKRRGWPLKNIMQTMMQAKWELAFLCFFLFKQASREILFLFAKNVFFSLQGFHLLTEWEKINNLKLCSACNKKLRKGNKSINSSIWNVWSYSWADRPTCVSWQISCAAFSSVLLLSSTSFSLIMGQGGGFSCFWLSNFCIVALRASSSAVADSRSECKVSLKAALSLACTDRQMITV